MCIFVTLSPSRPSVAPTLKYTIGNIDRKLRISFPFIIPKKLSAKYINFITLSKRINSSGKKIAPCSCCEKAGEKIT
jgi:hypothetical protein